MAFTTSVSYTVTVSGGGANQFVHTSAYDGQSACSVTIAPAASNFPVALAFNDTTLESFVMWSDAAMTVVFKDSSNVTVATYNLIANNPIIWNTDLGTANPFGDPVASLLVTSTPGGTLTVYAGNDI